MPRAPRVVPILVALPFVVVNPAAQAADFTYLAQSRYVGAGVEATDDIKVVNDSQFFSAPDFAPFDEVAQAYGNIGGSGCAASGFQRSSLNPHAIHVFESHSAWAEVFAEVGSDWASGESRCNVDFRLEQSSGFVLRGFVEAYDNGGAVVILWQGGTELYIVQATSNEHIDFEEFAGLSPGDYRLTVETSGYANGYPFQNQYSFGSIDVSMILDSATDAPAVVSSPAARPTVFPNPFRAGTQIRLAAPARELDVYDLAGRLVRRWTGATSVDWDVIDAAGRDVPAGVYFLRAGDAPNAESVKLVRLR